MIVVSISCITYNHAPYIRQCLDGFLMQQCNFDYEILIHDDASTDGTQEIIREYQEKYPDIIKPLIQKENQWSKGIRSMNATFNFPRAQGKYIALCEGDDYWTDPYKLQKQVDFLEDNSEFVLSHTNCIFYYQTKKLFSSEANTEDIYLKNHKDKKDLFYSILDGKLKIRTATVVFKNVVKKNENEPSFTSGDTSLWLELSQKGKFHYLNESTTVYRVSEGTASRPKSILFKLKFSLEGCIMRFFYCKKFEIKPSNKLINKYNTIIIDYSYFSHDTKSYIIEDYLFNKTKKKLHKNSNRLLIYNKLYYYILSPRLFLGIIKKGLIKVTGIK